MSEVRSLDALIEQFRQSIEEDDDPHLPYTPHLRAVHSRTRGYAQRVPGVLTTRLHDLLSRHEYHALLMFEWSAERYRNIREQFPLPLGLTRELARQMNLKHPWNRFKGEDAIISVDFLLTKADGTWIAVDFKESSISEKKRTREKLDLAEMALAKVGVPHLRMTEKDIPKTRIRNYRFLRSLTLPFDPPPLETAQFLRAAGPLRAALENQRATIYSAAVAVSQTTAIEASRLSRACLWLVANRKWHVDLSEPIGPDLPLRFITP